MNAFKCEVVVGKNGRIEVPVSDLPEGIEAIFLIKPNVLTWEELSQRIDAAGEDLEQLSS